MKSGIYKLTWEEGYFYYGQTCNFIQRKSSHLSKMRNGTHNNRYMIKLYKKYGVPKFNIILKCNISQLNKEEQKYIDENISNRKCCNISKNADRGTQRGVKLSNKTKGLISKAHLGKKISEEHKKAISEGLYKVYATGTVILPKRTGKLNHYFGKKHSEEIRIKMRKSKNVGENNSKARLVINTETGIFYECIKYAAISTNTNISTFYNKIKNNKTPFKYA